MAPPSTRVEPARNRHVVTRFLRKREAGKVERSRGGAELERALVMDRGLCAVGGDREAALVDATQHHGRARVAVGFGALEPATRSREVALVDRQQVVVGAAEPVLRARVAGIRAFLEFGQQSGALRRVLERVQRIHDRAGADGGGEQQAQEQGDDAHGRKVYRARRQLRTSRCFASEPCRPPTQRLPCNVTSNKTTPSAQTSGDSSHGRSPPNIE